MDFSSFSGMPNGTLFLIDKFGSGELNEMDFAILSGEFGGVQGSPLLGVQ